MIQFAHQNDCREMLKKIRQYQEKGFTVDEIEAAFILSNLARTGTVNAFPQPQNDIIRFPVYGLPVPFSPMLRPRGYEEILTAYFRIYRTLQL